MRHTPEEAELGRRVLEVALEALAGVPELMAQNRRMLTLYDRYVSRRAFDRYEECIPFTVAETTDEDYPITLITEAPDETIYGEDFRIAQEGQYVVVRAVARLLAGEHIGARVG